MDWKELISVCKTGRDASTGLECRLRARGNDKVSAEQAETSGLINRVLPSAKLLDAAEAMALAIARNDQLAVSLTKRAINRSCEIAGMRDALAEGLETYIQVENTQTDHSREFGQILRTQGTRAAIAWRDAKITSTG